MLSAEAAQWALAAALAVLPLGVATACLLAPPATGPVAAVFPPWWDDARSIATAGRVIRFGAFGFVVVSAADRPGLRAAGAWLLLDPRAIGACAPSGRSLRKDTS
jgi:hypothetical protein